MYNMKRNYRKETIEAILKNKPHGRLVANKYKVLAGMLRRRHPGLATVDSVTLVAVVFDAVQGNREWQQLTEGYDTLNKEVKSQEWKMEQGYHDLPPTVANTPTRRDARDVR